MKMQWARAHFGAGTNVVLGFQPAAGAAGALSVPRARSAAPRTGWLNRLDAWFWRQEQKQREAYLAQATDLVDLEERMRRLERAPRGGFQ